MEKNGENTHLDFVLGRRHASRRKMAQKAQHTCLGKLERFNSDLFFCCFFFAGVKFSFLVRISPDFQYFGLILSPKILITLPRPKPKLSKPSLTNLFI